MCIALPDVLVELVLRGMWRDLMVLRRWHTAALQSSLFDDWPPRTWQPRPVPQPSPEPRDFTPQSLEQLVSTVKSWAPLLERVAAAMPVADDGDMEMGAGQDIGASVKRVATVLTWRSAGFSTFFFRKREPDAPGMQNAEVFALRVVCWKHKSFGCCDEACNPCFPARACSLGAFAAFAKEGRATVKVDIEAVPACA